MPELPNSSHGSMAGSIVPEREDDASITEQDFEGSHQNEEWNRKISDKNLPKFWELDVDRLGERDSDLASLLMSIRVLKQSLNKAQEQERQQYEFYY